MSLNRIFAAATAGVVLACSPSMLAQSEQKDRGSRQSQRGREKPSAKEQQRGEGRQAAPPRQAQPAARERQTPGQAGGRQSAPAPSAVPRQQRETGNPGRQFGTPRPSTPTPQPSGRDQEMRRQPTPSYSGRPAQPRDTTPSRTGSRPAQPSGMTPSYPGRGPAQPSDTTPSRTGSRPAQPSGMTPSYSGSRPATSHGSYRSTEVIRTRNGGQVYRGPGGTIREVRTPGGAVIHHAPGGVRRVEVVRPGGHVVVTGARGRVGYVQRPLVVHNVSYVQRTYVYRGASHVRLYRPWVWGGVTFHVYTPMRYYHPAFYTWAWSPWARPVYYSWGWAGSPWYGYYGGWFSPYPYYTSPALWLTDYLIARTLEDAYDERMAERAAAAQANYGYGQTPLTPDVKQAIADEVHRQLEEERAQQGQYNTAAPGLFNDNASHVFVVSNPLNVNDGGMGCALTEGDVLQMNSSPAPGSPTADVVVLASKGQDCRKGSRVQVGLDDLQEMYNDMLATVDQGLNDLQSKQGQDGIPALPADARGAISTPLASEVQPDANAASELSQAAQEAERGEQDVVSQADSSGTINISLGMSIGDVERALGKPRQIADLGAKKVYIYPEMKIIFTDGKVSDVQ